MRKYILAIVVNMLLTAVSVRAQHAIGNWQSYLSYHNVTQTACAGNLIYALANGDLFVYDTEDQSIRTYYKTNMLNDTDISHIAYNKKFKTLVIVYKNANIDLLINDRETYNLPDYMNKNIAPKDVNYISFQDEYAYLSTSFGILTINLKKKEISNAYVLNKKINSTVSDGTKIYAASDEGLFTGKLTDNLLDVNNWKKVGDENFMFLALVKEELIGYSRQKDEADKEHGLFVINKQDYSYKPIVENFISYFHQNENGNLLAGNNGQLMIFRSSKDYSHIHHNQNITYFVEEKGMYWGACYYNGLQGFTVDLASNTLQKKVNSVIPDSPKRNLINQMKFVDDRLYVAGGGINQDRMFNPGTIMCYEGNEWTNFEDETISEKTGLPYQDITSIAEDPKDPNHVFASSAGEGLYEFQNGKFVKLYNRHNSPLEPSLTDPEYIDKFVRVNGLTYHQGDLWMTNSFGDITKTIKVLTNEKKWFSLDYPELSGKNLKYILFDTYGQLWVLSTNSQSSSGVFCANLNKTPYKVSDDQSVFIHTLRNQDGNSLADYRMYCMTLDKEGHIWLGTNMGPLVITNPKRVFESNFYCTQIKVPRNDGTNFADFLLASETINAITVDGANRKWIGTESNGVYLISADGLETIHHFTKENSPLISDNITSIAIHPNTGEVFIGTNKGLVSYMGDATEADTEFAEEVYAYPNPVYPDYTGVITVTGLVKDSDVKIVNTGGKLVYKGTSVGGQFTWDGCNLHGKRAASGVYFVLAAKPDGSKGVVTKIVLVN